MSGGVWYETYKESEISIVRFWDFASQLSGVIMVYSQFVPTMSTISRHRDKSGKQIATLIESEISGGIPAANIFLTGYS